MSKQTFSVADFATILILVNEQISKIERKPEVYCFSGENIEEKQKEADKEYKKRLEDPFYLNLKHLQKSLQNLNIEVETPEVEIKDKIKK